VARREEEGGRKKGEGEGEEEEEEEEEEGEGCREEGREKGREGGRRKAVLWAGIKTRRRRNGLCG
jgi:hypothetical protein